MAEARRLEGPLPPMAPEEAAVVAKAIDKRRKEMAFGRDTARRLLAKLGHEAPCIPRSASRAPVWPEGTWGSITHTDEVVLVAVSPVARPSFGLDLEGAEPLDESLIPYVLRPEERRSGPDRGLHAKLVFSAKEAFYKAQYVHTDTLLDFLDVRLTMTGAPGSFEVEVVHEASHHLRGMSLRGKWTRIDPFVLTAAWVGE